mmetsp:Transcript_34958/g.87526  ORF Transcript_34958/g.87526 Transcript_34958/m.87526 type:complete len:417 (-) Transcript_34958:476-1726(-)
MASTCAMHTPALSTAAGAGGRSPAAAARAIGSPRWPPVLRARRAVAHASRPAAVTAQSAASLSFPGCSRPAPRPLVAVEPAAARSPAIVAAASAAEEAGGGGIGETLYLGGLFLAWYAFSVGFGVFNKQVLNVFPHPTTLTLLNLACGSLIALVLWTTGLQKRPKLTKDMLLRILPLAVVHTIGNLLTNISLGKVAVSFTHTIKSCEPFFSVVLSAIFLGDIPSVALVASLVPLVAGIALASFTEPSFHWVGLFSALGANLTFTSRNVFSKKVMGSVKASLDNINLFSIITVMSMFLCAPVTLAMDGLALAPGTASAEAFSGVMSKALMAGVCFHSYQQLSYMVLQRVTPVTHSVGKCVKSVVVIVASIIAFNNPIGPLNAAGTALALFGVCCYSYVKIQQKKAKEAAAAAAAGAN